MPESTPVKESDFFQTIQNTPMSEADLQVVPLLLQGIKKLELENPIQAFEVFSAAVLQSPQSFKACYLLGRTALSLEKFEEAETALGNALSLDPENIEVLYLIAHTHVLQDKVEEAVGEFLLILEKRPDFADAYYDCGVVLQLLGRYDEAVGIFEKRLAISPDFESALMCAMTYELLQNYEKTETYYTQALELDPENGMVLESRGKVLIEMDRLEEALTDFDRALEIDPQSPDALCGRGQVLFYQGEDFEEAERVLTLAARLDSENAVAWSILGQIRLYESQYKEALECLEKALEIDPELLIYDFRASAKRGLGDLKGALEDISLALEYEPENEDYLIDQGAILVEMDQIEDALKIFNQVVQEFGSADAYRFRGMALMEQMEYEKAVKDFDAAVRKGAQNLDIFLRRGEAFYQLGETEKALRNFSQAKELALSEGDEGLAQKCERFLKELERAEKEDE